MGELVGRSLAHFRVLRKLGEGGMGVVYEAKDEKLGRAVALKVLPEGLAQDAGRRARFLREARSAAAVTHPNIAAVYEIGEAQGRVFIAMELVRGRSLRELLSQRLEIPQALRLARDVALGLGRAHEEHIVHRDLKPENVMVTSRGDVKILDFGLAKALESAPSSPASELAGAATEPVLTREGHVLGTPEYMSPEQASGAALDARSDVFALGVMLYEMLCGERPFRGGTAIAVLLATTTKEPEPLERKNPSVPPDLARIVARCLSKTPGARYAGGQEVADALLAIEAWSSNPAAPSASLLTPDAASLPPEGPKPASRSRWLLPAAVGLACIAATGGALVRARIHPAVEAPAASGAAALADGVRRPGVRALTELPLPESSNPEALAAYKRGLQLMRDAAYRGALNEFEQALLRDGSLAGAHLRSALLGLGASLNYVQTGQRDHFRAAVAGRASLPEHDKLLLDAMEPAFRQPRHLAECEARLRTVLAHAPDDVEYMFWRAFVLHATGAVGDARALFEQAVAIDPSFCLAWSRYGDIVDGTSNDAGPAYRAYEACMAACPNATRCLRSRILLAANDGKCTLVDGDAKTLVSLEPEDPYWQKWLARSLVAQGASVDAVRLVDKRLEALTGESDRPRAVLWDAIALDELAGDFASARGRLQSLHTMLEPEVHEPAHLDVADEAAQIELEIGAPARADAAAQDYLRRVDAWTLEGWGFEEGRALMWSASRAAGGLSSAELGRRREAWLEKAKAVEGWTVHRKILWQSAYGYFLDPSAAGEAVAAMTEYEPELGVGDRGPREDLAIGRALLLGGRERDAIPFLKRAASSCRAL